MHEHHREPPCCACPGCGQACDDCTCGPSTDSDIRAAASRVLNEVAVHDSESLSGSLLSFERDVTMLARFALDTLAPAEREHRATRDGYPCWCGHGERVMDDLTEGTTPGDARELTLERLQAAMREIGPAPRMPRWKDLTWAQRNMVEREIDATDHATREAMREAYFCGDDECPYHDAGRWKGGA